jgi:hypothetical protein
MMDQSDSIMILYAERCAVCGRPKGPKTAFCKSCYFSLPAEVRKSLWMQVGAGFEDAYENAVAVLTEMRERAAIAAEGKVEEMR